MIRQKKKENYNKRLLSPLLKVVTMENKTVLVISIGRSVLCIGMKTSILYHYVDRMKRRSVDGPAKLPDCVFLV